MHRPPHDDGWRIPDSLWDRIAPLLPPPPDACPRRVPDRRAMDAIFFVLRTGCHWADLNATGICSSSAAHRRYMTWVAAGVFLAIRDLLPQCDAGADGLDWAWYPRPSPAGAAPEPARLPG